MTKNKPVISFPATVASIKTLVDGGLRVTFDLPEDAISQAAALMACKKDGIALTVEVKADTGGVA